MNHPADPLPIFESFDLYIGDLARNGRRPSTRRTYARLLRDFGEQARVRYVHELTLNHYERFLDRWTDAAPSTLASGVSLCHGYSTFLFERGYAATNIAAMLKRPRRLRAEDLDVVTISSDDVARMFDACEDWQEFLCLATAAYLGARRNALALLRWGDVNLVRGTARFHEKGGKVITKPIAREYQKILVLAQGEGFGQAPEEYVIPNRRPASVKGKERSNKIIWETVKRVARRAGVSSHVHALRAAFAVAFDDAHPDRNLDLQNLMGHIRFESTMVYLRRRNKAAGMEAVRDLSWGHSPAVGFSSEAREAHTGFEPVPPEDRLSISLRRKIGSFAPRVPRG